MSNQNQILKNVELQCSIEGLCATTTMTYHFTNPYKEDIEALYRIPLPTHAVFQSLEFEVEGKKYQGEVYTPAKASQKYEEAIVVGYNNEKSFL